MTISSFFFKEFFSQFLLIKRISKIYQFEITEGIGQGRLSIHTKYSNISSKLKYTSEKLSGLCKKHV